ncbi:UNVERIFIED_CONTAM: hypothetical protein RF648_11885 [Kocuria sp. CPCC 205274]
MAASDNDRRPPHRRRAERTGSTAAPPVFFDPSGKRWYRILATLVVLLALAAGAVSWIVPQALAQPWERPLHQEPGYPRELIATGDQENIPLLGDATTRSAGSGSSRRRTPGRCCAVRSPTRSSGCSPSRSGSSSGTAPTPWSASGSCRRSSSC